MFAIANVVCCAARIGGCGKTVRGGAEQLIGLVKYIIAYVLDERLSDHDFVVGSFDLRPSSAV
jgi:hypothetical protein